MKTADALFEALETETLLYRELADSFKNESGTLARMTVREIIGMTIGQEEIIQRIRGNAERRANAAGLLAGELGLENAPVTLSALLLRVDESEKSKLGRLKARLEEAVAAAKAARDMNVRLLDTMLGQIDKTIHVLGGSAGRQDGYGPGQSVGASAGLLSSRL